jgi:Transposase, Mutator family
MMIKMKKAKIQLIIMIVHFPKCSMTFCSLEQVTKQVAVYEKDNDIQIKIKHSDPSRMYHEYICNSHQGCPFLCRFGHKKRGSTMVCAKKCNLKHRGVLISDRDKGLVQALKDVFPINHTTQCSIHIQQNVAAKFRSKVAADVCNISKTFSVYHKNKMLENMKESSELAYDYLVGDNGIEPSKWRSTEWMKDTTLPPRYGIVSMNISEF